MWTPVRVKKTRKTESQICCIMASKLAGNGTPRQNKSLQDKSLYDKSL
jgi:hypothetical protein